MAAPPRLSLHQVQEAEVEARVGSEKSLEGVMPEQVGLDLALGAKGVGCRERLGDGLDRGDQVPFLELPRHLAAGVQQVDHAQGDEETDTWRLSDLEKDGNGLSRKHWALGTIRYGGNQTGQLLYINASLTGDENLYVQDYAELNPQFPHPSTTYQSLT